MPLLQARAKPQSPGESVWVAGRPGTPSSVSWVLPYTHLLTLPFVLRPGLGANKLPTSDGSVLAEGRFLETLMFPAWEEGVFRTACHSFRLHLEVVQRMPRKGETHGPSPLLRVILCGLPLQVCSEVWCKLSGLAGLLDCGLMSSLGYSFEGRCALW